MGQIKLKLAALGAAVVLAGCGGGGDGVDFDSTVSFGDSLSDMGSYKVGTIAAVGGGKWTVNSSTAQNWTELVAASASHQRALRRADGPAAQHPRASWVRPSPTCRVAATMPRAAPA